MGNGYPVAGIAASPDVLAAFGHDVRYFNTFGGNTVAIAAAQATLDVIQDDGLLDNAKRVGTILRDGFSGLCSRYDQVGDVRGAGLYWGLEIIADGDGKVADGTTAAALVNALRRRRVLISATGSSGNVLKIRPSLVFTPEDADRLLTQLGEALGETRAQTR
jgi:4-aminobutyrate aminotransferase-like enzyme